MPDPTRRSVRPAIVAALALLPAFALRATPSPAAPTAAGTPVPIAASPTVTAPTPIDRLRAAALADEMLFRRLTYLCDRIGARPAGSEAYLRAAAWGESTFTSDALDAVRQEPATVRAWVRGRERWAVTAPFGRDLVALGLGGAGATAGFEAPVVLARSLADLGAHVRDRIVLFVPDLPAGARGGERYGTFSALRARGPSEAAKLGARGALVGSAPISSLATPHTGGTWFAAGVAPIPAASLSAEDASWIARLVRAGVEVRVRMESESHDGGDAPAPNVVAEIRGAQRPDEIVLVGGHLDSWDVGQGAHDDGAGVVHTIETMRLIRALGLKPARTIRAVLFANEEHGSDGGKAYAATHGGERHVAALESDLGADRPHHWGATGTPAQLAWLLPLVSATSLPLAAGGGGVDIQPLAETGVLVIGLVPELDRYFDVHHTNADTIDHVDEAHLRAGLAAVAVLTWQLANAPAP